MSSVTNGEAKRRKILSLLKPQIMLGTLFVDWNERNKTQNNKLSFPDWVANRDELDQLNARVTKEVLNLQAQIENISTKLDEVLRRDEDTETDEEFLKKPRSQAEFDAIRSTIYEFNKKNYKLGVRGKKVATWGEHQEFFDIECKKSFVAWLESEHAKELSLGPSTIDRFEVCVVRGKLVTLSKDYKGGIGLEALWIPDNKYDEAVCTQSTRYRSAAHKKNDPRLGYEFNGVKWTYPATNKKKRKRPTV